MTDYLIYALTVYVWIIGGVLLAFVAADETFRGKSRYRIAAVIILWPILVMGSTVMMLCEATARGWKKLIRRFE